MPPCEDSDEAMRSDDDSDDFPDPTEEDKRAIKQYACLVGYNEVTAQIVPPGDRKIRQWEESAISKRSDFVKAYGPLIPCARTMKAIARELGRELEGQFLQCDKHSTFVAEKLAKMAKMELQTIDTVNVPDVSISNKGCLLITCPCNDGKVAAAMINYHLRMGDAWTHIVYGNDGDGAAHAHELTNTLKEYYDELEMVRETVNWYDEYGFVAIYKLK
jgi:hypothetical protein